MMNLPILKTIMLDICRTNNINNLLAWTLSSTESTTYNIPINIQKEPKMILIIQKIKWIIAKQFQCLNRISFLTRTIIMSLIKIQLILQTFLKPLISKIIIHWIEHIILFSRITITIGNKIMKITRKSLLAKNHRMVFNQRKTTLQNRRNNWIAKMF